MVEYEDTPNIEDYLNSQFVLQQAGRSGKSVFFTNFIFCVILGVFTLDEPELLPYFILLTLFSVGMILYQQFIRVRLNLARRRNYFKHSPFLHLPRVVCLYGDRVEITSQNGEGQTSFITSFPYQLLTQVLESGDCFFLFLSGETMVPVRKKECSLSQQNQLRSLFSRYCRNYQEMKA